MAELSPVTASEEHKAALTVLAQGADWAGALLATLDGRTSARIAQGFGVRQDRVRLRRSDVARGAGSMPRGRASRRGLCR